MPKRDYSCRIFLINILSTAICSQHWSVVDQMPFLFTIHRRRLGRNMINWVLIPQLVEHERNSSTEFIQHLTYVLSRAVSRDIRLNHDRARHIFQTHIPTMESTFRTILLQKHSRNILRTPTCLDTKSNGGATDDNESGLKSLFK